MLYRGFPSKLHHTVPSWVEYGAVFHIRIRLDREVHQRSLTDKTLGPLLLESARFYQTKQRWYITIFLLMPDHVHAILAFPGNADMSATIGDWKHYHTRVNKISWQEGFFDHRLRDDELGQQLAAKIDYIRNNPVAAGLCDKVADWAWVIDAARGDPAISKGGSAGRAGQT
jgi:putative transposase